MKRKKHFVMNFIYGFKCFFRGLSFIKKNKLWKYIFIPALLNFILLSFIFYGLYYLSLILLKEITIYFIGFLGKSTTTLPIFIQYLFEGFSFFIGIFFSVIFYRILISLIIIPFLGPLLNRTEELISGNRIEVTLLQDISNALRGGLIGIKFAIFGIIVLVLTIPLGPFQAPINILLQGYFLGRSAFDYIFEKESFIMNERKKLVRNYIGEIIGMGTAFFLFLFIPVLGALISPAAAVVGAALLYHTDPQKPAIIRELD